MTVSFRSQFYIREFNQNSNEGLDKFKMGMGNLSAVRQIGPYFCQCDLMFKLNIVKFPLKVAQSLGRVVSLTKLHFSK